MAEYTPEELAAAARAHDVQAREEGIWEHLEDAKRECPVPVWYDITVDAYRGITQEKLDELLAYIQTASDELTQLKAGEAP